MPCLARLGETIGECHQRYGEPKSDQTEEYGRAKHEVFVVNDFQIDVFYLDEKAVEVCYAKKIGGINLDEASSILVKESGENPWGDPHTPETGEIWWKRDDGSSALITSGSKPTLCIVSEGWQLAHSLISDGKTSKF